MSQIEQILKMLPVALEYANKNLDAVNRVREILREWENDIASTTEQYYFNQILEALDGEQ